MSLKSNLMTAGTVALFFYRDTVREGAATACNVGMDYASRLWGYIVALPQTANSYIHQGQVAGLQTLDGMLPGARQLLTRKISAETFTSFFGQKSTEIAKTSVQTTSMAVGTLAVAVVPALLPMAKYCFTSACRYWQGRNQDMETDRQLDASCSKLPSEALTELQAYKAKLEAEINQTARGYKALSERDICSLNPMKNKFSIGLTLLTCVALAPQFTLAGAAGVAGLRFVSKTLFNWCENSANKEMVVRTNKNIAKVTSEISKKKLEVQYKSLNQAFIKLQRDYGQLSQEHQKMQSNQQRLVNWYNTSHSQNQQLTTV